MRGQFRELSYTGWLPVGAGDPPGMDKPTGHLKLLLASVLPLKSLAILIGFIYICRSN